MLQGNQWLDAVHFIKFEQIWQQYGEKKKLSLTLQALSFEEKFKHDTFLFYFSGP